MGCNIVIFFVVLFFQLAAFNCDSYKGICKTEAAETSAEPNFQINEAFYAFNVSMTNGESDISRQKRNPKGSGGGSGSGSGKGSGGGSGNGSGSRSGSGSQKGYRRSFRRGFGGNPETDSGGLPDSSSAGGSGEGSTNGFGISSATISARATGPSPKLISLPVTDADIETFTNDLWQLSANNVNRYITVTRGQRNANGIVRIEQPLLRVDRRALNISTIAKVRAMRDDYNLDITKAEYISANMRKAEDRLIAELILQPVIAKMIAFLENKRFINRGTGRETLKQIWFGLYSREVPRRNKSSSGFQHVFLAELKPGTHKTIRGLHNWIYFNAKEVDGNLVYKGCIKNIPLGSKGSILKFRSTFKTEDGESIAVPSGVMFIGTSPEMEIALYTLCFFVRPNGKCPVSLNGNKLNIITKFVKRNRLKMVSTAYPEVVSSTMDLWDKGC